jgi:hypothetical protein
MVERRRVGERKVSGLVAYGAPALPPVAYMPSYVVRGNRFH